MIVLDRLRFLKRLNCAQNWHESHKIRQKWLPLPGNSRLRRFLR